MRDNKSALFPAWTVEHIQPQHVLAIFWIEENYIVLTAAGDMPVQEVVIESAMWIDNGYAGAGVKVPTDHIADDSALPCASRTKQYLMFASCLGGYRKDGLFILVPVLFSNADWERVEHGGMIEF